ncbi:MAG: RidA family protein [Bacteroidetes bacterium]|nr:RidA family protein [Bacteroidota bacterium]
MKKIISTPKAPKPIGPYSQAVLVDNTLYVSGQIPVNPETGSFDPEIKVQTNQVMKNIEAILLEAGLGFENIVKTSIFIIDMNNFAQVNEVYGSFFKSDFPARETVQVSKLPLGVDVEISVIAVK